NGGRSANINSCATNKHCAFRQFSVPKPPLLLAATRCASFSSDRKPKEMKSKIEKLPSDILTQIEFQFAKNHKKVLQILETELTENDFLNSNRIIRCIIFLSENSVEKLNENINSAKIDWRNIILWAEYENDQNNEPKLKRDFNKPF
ncbi:hypothetical protein LIT07_12075, partial [Flavobacterium psychrophilum]|nr:hypothetical protein [Flavobacterium psychrophilum]MCB5979334.1 hypothetical protein [Flavobacterium psychrophilum]MCB6065080.1 hypothetical protein [Flavobacterium psychrophilum]MCB6067494.1 hypothetical protein [Flavobacterium psychrophilum]